MIKYKNFPKEDKQVKVGKTKEAKNTNVNAVEKYTKQNQKKGPKVNK